jgi:hypothetical protein
LIVLTLEGNQISAMTRSLDRSVMRGFGLPATLRDRRFASLIHGLERCGAAAGGSAPRS